MIKIGVIGYGYWGPNLVRNFMEAQALQLLRFAICGPSAWPTCNSLSHIVA